MGSFLSLLDNALIETPKTLVGSEFMHYHKRLVLVRRNPHRRLYHWSNYIHPAFHFSITLCREVVALSFLPFCFVRRVQHRGRSIQKIRIDWPNVVNSLNKKSVQTKDIFCCALPCFLEESVGVRNITRR